MCRKYLNAPRYDFNSFAFFLVEWTFLGTCCVYASTWCLPVLVGVRWYWLPVPGFQSFGSSKLFLMIGSAEFIGYQRHIIDIYSIGDRVRSITRPQKNQILTCNTTKEIQFQAYNKTKEIQFRAYNKTKEIQFQAYNKTKEIQFQAYNKTKEIQFQAYNKTKEIQFQAYNKTKEIQFRAYNKTKEIQFQAYNKTKEIQFDWFSHERSAYERFSFVKRGL